MRPVTLVLLIMVPAVLLAIVLGIGELFKPLPKFTADLEPVEHNMMGHRFVIPKAYTTWETGLKPQDDGIDGAILMEGTAPGGIDLGQAMADLADGLARKAAADGLGPVVRGLQTGLPFIEPRAERLHGPPRDGGGLAFAPAGLKVDGIAGPKTRAATRRAVAALGAKAVAGAVGVGRFEDILRQGRLTAASLATAADALFAWPRPGRMGYGPARNLQGGVNDLGRATFGRTWPQIAVDGVIGPQTVAAVERLHSLYRRHTVARYLGEAFAII